MNCKDYQDDLRIRAANDEAAQQTKQMLEVRFTTAAVQLLTCACYPWWTCGTETNLFLLSVLSDTSCELLNFSV